MIPIRPVPNSQMVAGVGTGEGVASRLATLIAN